MSLTEKAKKAISNPKLTAQIAAKTVRRLPIWQKPTSSYEEHNAQYLEEGKLEVERKVAQSFRDQDLFNSPEMRLKTLLDKYPTIRDVAVDVGSGAGWLSAELSPIYKKVIGIEPSAKAVEIAQELYPAKKFPNIEWIVGFAEDKLPTLNLTTPTLFVTGCVLSHLQDKSVITICKAINNIATTGSILSFAECWGKPSNHNMWHTRSKEWWQQALNGWEINFHGEQIQNVPGRYKGFHAVRVK